MYGEEFLAGLDEYNDGSRHRLGGFARPVHNPVERDVALGVLHGDGDGDLARLTEQHRHWHPPKGKSASRGGGPGRLRQ
ncbi:hypothetical protein ACWCQQ_43705 [Streptomyces sp. NPDC002143]